jgi:multidrug efflux pump subunit AcrA (membrane-fusion protein)
MGTLAASMREIGSMMNYATLVAPIDGTVSQILARPGDLATPGKPLVRISSKAGLYLNISLPDTLRAEQVMLEHHVLPLTSKEQTGETGLVQYVAPLPQNLGLVEGQFVNVRVVVYQGEDVLLPIDALLTMDGTSSVFMMGPDGKAQRLFVKIKARGIEGAIVDQDLAGRTVVVAKPDILLRVASGVPLVERNL